MTENEQEIIDSTNDTEETVNDTIEVADEEIEVEVEPEAEVSEDGTADDTEALRKQIATLRAQKEHWKKKATTQTTEKKDKVEAPTTKNIELTSLDTFALIKAGVEQEDIADVVEIAKVKNISVTEALKTSAVRAILAEKKEERTVAQATSVSGQRRGTSRVSDEVLLEKAMKSGELPTSDEDMVRLIRARRAAKN